MVYDQTIRTKESLLARKRHYNKAIPQIISFVEAFTSILQIYAFLFKSIQILLCKNKYIHIVTSRECIHNLFFHVLYSRQTLFIHSMRSKTVYLFTLFFTSLTLPFVMYFQSYAISIIVCFFFFQTHAFFTNGGSSWVGIKIAIEL